MLKKYSKLWYELIKIMCRKSAGKSRFPLGCGCLIKVRYFWKNIGIISIAPQKLLLSILRFVIWIFLPLDTAVQLESADAEQNAISKSLFQDSFRHIFGAMRKMHHTFWEKATFIIGKYRIHSFPPETSTLTLLHKIFYICHSKDLKEIN